MDQQLPLLGRLSEGAVARRDEALQDDSGVSGGAGRQGHHGAENQAGLRILRVAPQASVVESRWRPLPVLASSRLVFCAL